MNLMEPIFLSLFANIIRMYAIYRCMEHFFLSKDENKISKICMYTGFVLVNSVGYYLFNNMFINISTNIIGLLFITTLYKCNFLKKLLMVVLIYIINIIVESGVLYIFSYDMQTDIFWVSVYECITSMGILLIVVLLEKTISVKRKNSQIEGFLWVVLLGIPIVSIGMVVVLVRNEIEKSYLIVVEVIGLLVINLIIFYLYNALENFYIQKKEQELIKQQINMYENELEIMKKSYYNIRGLRHDMKHHMMELKFLVKKGAYDEILSYIDSMGIFMLNGVDESSCSKIRGEGVFEKVVETVHFLKENGCGEISLSMVICDKNQDLEEEFKKLNIKLGTHPIVRVLSFVGRGKEKRDELSLMSQGEVYIPDKFFDTERPYVFWGNCLEKNRKRMIRANGDIYTCPLIIDEELKENNILRVSDLSEVENGKLYNLKEKLLSQNPKCRTCKVNPFCWNCIATIKENTENGAMDDYCSKVKAFYFNTVWGE